MLDKRGKITFRHEKDSTISDVSSESRNVARGLRKYGLSGLVKFRKKNKDRYMPWI